MRLVYLCGFIAAAMSAIAATPNGNEILARAGAAKGLTSYSVPVHFDVHMHRPVGIRAGVDGIVMYNAPAQAVLKLTNLPAPLKKFFKDSYAIDLAVQVWPAKYRVTSMSEGKTGTDTYVLQAVPKETDPSTDHVVFTVAQSDGTPLSAAWYYTDGSTVALLIQNARTSGYMLPQTETISVAMPGYSLDATATYGAYNLNGSGS